MQITSKKNPFLQAIRRAAAFGEPTPEGLVVAEGPHLVEEAFQGSWPVEWLVVSARRERSQEFLNQFGGQILEVSDEAFASISATEHAQGILALVRPPDWSWNDLLGGATPISQTLLVALDGIQDPGNAGTIVRSAEAFGASGVIFLKGSVHVANGKFLRATAGSIFRMRFLEAVSESDFLAQMRSSGLELFALAAKGRITIEDADFRRHCALVVGNEGSGVNAQLLAAAQAVGIPTGQVESLNAAVACSITLFAVQQQRQRKSRENTGDTNGPKSKSAVERRP